MTKNTITAYSISEISQWQAELAQSEKPSSTSGKIILPSLQRGFVWKPYQIESLWDSILRGYPVGAVLMSVDEESNTKELLDGQQRCTSIALGFYNPFEQKEFTFFNAGAKNIVPSLWIDLHLLEANPNGIKYPVRVLTKSHPWGYQLRDHRSTLSMSDRKNALQLFQELENKGDIAYTALSPENIYPYDSHCPIPLALVLNAYANDSTNWRKPVIRWIEDNKNRIHTKHYNSDVETYHNIEEKLNALEAGLSNAFQLLLPQISIAKKLLNESENSSDEENGDATLFVRLNSEGTRISGEELIYSLFKSAFPESQQLVENLSGNMFAPSRTINLFVRLALHELNDFSHYRNELTIKNFRQELGNVAFKNKMNEYINNEAPIANQLFQQLIEKLIIKQPDYQLPQIYTKELLRRNPDLTVVLLSYLRKKEQEKISSNFSQIVHHILLLNHDGKKTARHLFGLLVSNEWDVDQAFQELVLNTELMIQVVKPEVFEEMIVHVLLPEYQKNKGEHFGWVEFLEKAFEEFCSPSLKEKATSFQYINNNEEQKDENHITAFLTNFKYLADNFYWERLHLIAGQASYFQSQFQDYLEFEGIEDTNRPWDWDHIYPHSWVYQRKGVSVNIRWIVNLNGNFRALSYDENRSENNTYSPSQRLQDDQYKKNAFVFSENNSAYLNDWQHWQQITTQFHNNDDQIKTLTNALFFRVVNLYRNWYKRIYLNAER